MRHLFGDYRNGGIKNVTTRALTSVTNWAGHGSKQSMSVSIYQASMSLYGLKKITNHLNWRVCVQIRYVRDTKQKFKPLQHEVWPNSENKNNMNAYLYRHTTCDVLTDNTWGEKSGPSTGTLQKTTKVLAAQHQTENSAVGTRNVTNQICDNKT